MNKLTATLLFFGFLVGGAIVCAAIDVALGITYEEHISAVQVVHKVTYMVWGILIWDATTAFSEFMRGELK